MPQQKHYQGSKVSLPVPAKLDVVVPFREAKEINWDSKKNTGVSGDLLNRASSDSCDSFFLDYRSSAILPGLIQALAILIPEKILEKLLTGNSPTSISLVLPK